MQKSIKHLSNHTEEVDLNDRPYERAEKFDHVRVKKTVGLKSQ